MTQSSLLLEENKASGLAYWLVFLVKWNILVVRTD